MAHRLTADAHDYPGKTSRFTTNTKALRVPTTHPPPPSAALGTAKNLQIFLWITQLDVIDVRVCETLIGVGERVALLGRLTCRVFAPRTEF